MQSWRTTAAGWLGIAAVIVQVLLALLQHRDVDPVALMTALSAGAVGIAAKDHKD